MPVGGRGGGGVQALLTAAQLDQLGTPLFQRARFPIEEACLQAGIDLGTAAARQPSGKGGRREQRRRGGKGRDKAVRGGGGGAGGVQLIPKRRLPISAVLLVGGATRMASVRPFLRNMTGLEPLAGGGGGGVDPDLAVALGAAVHAGTLQGTVNGHMVLDVWQVRCFPQCVRC